MSLVWRVKTICDNCPFSKSEAGRALRASLRPGRMDEILDGLRRDGHFICHKTTNGRSEGPGNLQCAGALAWQKREGLPPNQMQRICERLSAASDREAAPPRMKSKQPKSKRPSRKWMPITEHDVTRLADTIHDTAEE